MHYYIHSRLSSFLHWKNITVIFSDANVPGEGEHKIVDFIRRQRQQPNYDLSTRHVMCGPDTDLIFLGLATHEAHVTIIREEQGSNQYKFVSLGVLRKYLEVDLRVKNLPFDFDLDHAIDDWVLLCTLIGNDFLPGLPFLTIEKGAIDTLVKIYKDCISKSKVR
jgi:5'-3' exoribonuclease 2